MRIMARESWTGKRAPFSSNVLTVIGILQFVGASWFVLGLTLNLREYLRPEVYILCLVVGISLGLSASVTSFAFARIVADLYATRWNTDGYEVERDDAERRMMVGMARDLSVIARALAPEQAEALEADVAQEIDPYDEEPALEEAEAPAKKPRLSLNYWLWVIAALLIGLVGMMIYLIVTR